MEHKPLSRKRKRDHGGAEVDDEKSRAPRFLGSEDSSNFDEDRSSTDPFSRDDDTEEVEGRPTEAVLSWRQSDFLHSLCNVNEDSSDITVANLRVIGLASFWEGGFPFDYSSSEEEDDHDSDSDSDFESPEWDEKHAGREFIRRNLELNVSACNILPSEKPIHLSAGGAIVTQSVAPQTKEDPRYSSSEEEDYSDSDSRDWDEKHASVESIRRHLELKSHYGACAPQIGDPARPGVPLPLWGPGSPCLNKAAKVKHIDPNCQSNEDAERKSLERNKIPKYRQKIGMNNAVFQVHPKDFNFEKNENVGMVLKSKVRVRNWRCKKISDSKYVAKEESLMYAVFTDVMKTCHYSAQESNKTRLIARNIDTLDLVDIHTGQRKNCLERRDCLCHSCSHLGTNVMYQLFQNMRIDNY